MWTCARVQTEYVLQKLASVATVYRELRVGQKCLGFIKKNEPIACISSCRLHVGKNMPKKSGRVGSGIFYIRCASSIILSIMNAHERAYDTI